METNFYNNISDYIEGLLEPAEKELFEKELLLDANLKKEVELQRYIHQAIFKEETTKEEVSKFKHSLLPLTKAYFSTGDAIKKPAKVVALKKWLAPLAVAASIIFAMIVLFPGNGIDSYTMPEAPAIVRGNETTDKAALLYAEEKYAQALPLYKTAVEKDSTQAGTIFFYALCLTKTNQYALALPLFEQLSNGATAYQDEASFFAALCAYKTGNEQKAKSYASRVSEKNKNYKRAQKIKNT